MWGKYWRQVRQLRKPILWFLDHCFIYKQTYISITVLLCSSSECTSFSLVFQILRILRPCFFLHTRFHLSVVWVKISNLICFLYPFQNWGRNYAGAVCGFWANFVAFSTSRLCWTLWTKVCKLPIFTATMIENGRKQATLWGEITAKLPLSCLSWIKFVKGRTGKNNAWNK